MRYKIALAVNLIAAVFLARSALATETENETVTLNIMSSSDPNSVFAINWPPVQYVNPFAGENVQYEIWHNDDLLDTVSTTRYTIRVSELSEKLGCISIRAVLGNAYSNHSAPACFFITDNQAL